MSLPAGHLRPITEQDLPACADVFYAALDELYQRTGQPPLPRNPETMVRIFGHLLSTDRQRCWLREAGEEITGFSIAQRRASSWFLSFLFVRPERQGAGDGRALVEACAAENGSGALAERWPLRNRAVCAEAIQPVSVGLYASLDMHPRVPLFLVTGRPRRQLPLPGVADLTALPFAELAAADHESLVRTVDELDASALGYAHPEDHRYWSMAGRHGWLFRDSGTGTPVGYGYVSPSGRIGPVAVSEARWLPEALGHLLTAIEPPDGWQLSVPGSSPVLPMLLRAGFRFDGSAALYCSTSEVPAFERYLLGSFAIL